MRRRTLRAIIAWSIAGCVFMAAFLFHLNRTSNFFRSKSLPAGLEQVQDNIKKK